MDAAESTAPLDVETVIAAQGIDGIISEAKRRLKEAFQAIAQERLYFAFDGDQSEKDVPSAISIAQSATIRKESVRAALVAVSNMLVDVPALFAKIHFSKLAPDDIEAARDEARREMHDVEVVLQVIYDDAARNEANSIGALERLHNAADMGVKVNDGLAKAHQSQQQTSSEKAAEWQQLADPIWQRNPEMKVRAVARQVANQYPVDKRPPVETIRRAIKPPIPPKKPTKKKSRR
jgi:hypothetical protein